MSTKLGGTLVLISETMFLFSIMNFLMITRLQYYSEGDSFIRSIFPHYTIFVLALVMAALAGMWFAYVFVIPSKQKFSQHQAVKDSRSPTYNLLLELDEKINNINNKLEIKDEENMVTKDHYKNCPHCGNTMTKKVRPYGVGDWILKWYCDNCMYEKEEKYGIQKVSDNTTTEKIHTLNNGNLSDIPEEKRKKLFRRIDSGELIVDEKD
jgi:transposase-like protein